MMDAEGKPVSRYEIFSNGEFSHAFNDLDEVEEIVKDSVNEVNKNQDEEHLTVKVIKMFE